MPGFLATIRRAAALRRAPFVEVVAVAVLTTLAVSKELLPDVVASYVPDPRVLLSITVILSCASLVVTLETLSTVRSTKGRVPCQRAPLASALHDILAKGPFQTLHVYALSSRYIQATIASSGTKIGSAAILLWEPKLGMHDAVFDASTAEVNQIIRSGWAGDKTRRLIGRTTVRRYSDLPDIYFMVFDRQIAVLGFYRRIGTTTDVVDYSDALVFEATSGEGAYVVDWLMSQHQSLWSTTTDEWSSDAEGTQRSGVTVTQ